MIEEKHSGILEYLMDTTTIRVLTHLWVMQAFDYGKDWMINYFKCDPLSLEKSLHKLTQLGLVEVVKRNGSLTFKYAETEVSRPFDSFMRHLCVCNVENLGDFIEGVGR